LATSIPTNRFTSSMFHPPQRGLPRLAIRDFFPLQPFGLSASGEAATLAARRDLAPKGAPVCRSTNSDSSTKSSTYKGVENPSKNRDNLASVLNTLRPKLASFLNFSSASGETRVNLACRQPRTVLGDGV